VIKKILQDIYDFKLLIINCEYLQKAIEYAYIQAYNLIQQKVGD
ncbi:2165_t:CDS:1, partial [Racocetra fulgida]